MTDIECIKNFTVNVVIIDDGFVPARLEMIQENDWGALRAAEDQDQWTPFREKYFPNVLRVMDLKRNDQALQKAWEHYDLNPEEFSILDPIFAHVRQSRAIDVQPLNEMIQYLGEEVGLKVLTHSDIPSAAEDIKRCKLIFLDFFLYQKTADEIIETIREHAQLFSSPIDVNGHQEGRIVFLISTSLPSQEDVERFRRATKLKGAFFKPVPKTMLNREWIKREVLAKITRYGDLQKWAGYLDMFSSQIRVVSEALRDEIESLELHDLSILDSMRLQVDSEHLGDYLSWLLSESLAARIRQAAPLVDAGHIVDKIGSTPFQGMLMPKQILFGLYSDVAFAAARESQVTQKIHFGDVFSVLGKSGEALSSTSTGSVKVIAPSDKTAIGVEQSKTSAQGGTSADPIDPACELVLVISPACDLQRCGDDYEVLCVRGKIVKQGADLADLLSHQAIIGRGEEVFKHLLRQISGASASYCMVEWTPKGITTILAPALRDGTKYVRKARLNELLGQEIKEEAFRQASRIGVPVDPSYSSALSAVVQIKRAKKDYQVWEAPDRDFVSGVFVSANEYNQAIIMLSEEFLAFLDQIEAECATTGFPLDEKLARAFKKLRSEGAKGVKLKADRMQQFDGGFRVRLLDNFERGARSGANEIIFFPRGRYAEVSKKSEVKVASAVSENDPLKTVIADSGEPGGPALAPVVSPGVASEAPTVPDVSSVQQASNEGADKHSGDAIAPE